MSYKMYDYIKNSTQRFGLEQNRYIIITSGKSNLFSILYNWERKKMASYNLLVSMQYYNIISTIIVKYQSEVTNKPVQREKHNETLIGGETICFWKALRYC